MSGWFEESEVQSPEDGGFGVGYFSDDSLLRLPPAPYQSVHLPFDPVREETGYYTRPVYLVDGKQLFVPKYPGQDTDLYLVEYKCWMSAEAPHDCSNTEKLALYRSAEVTVDRGYKCFAVRKQQSFKSCMPRGVSARFCRTQPYCVSMLIKLMHKANDASDENSTYDAHEIMASLRHEIPSLATHISR
jgi:hypothetical protein